MHELPEVETTRLGILPHARGLRLKQLVVRNPHLRWPVPPSLPALLAGTRLQDSDRRGKYLLMKFDPGTALCHLGMSGSLRVLNSAQAPGKHDHIDWFFERDVILLFNDPRRFGALLWQPDTEPLDEHPLLAHLGPEPLGTAFTARYLFERAQGSRLALKPWIMDAKVVVGVGNIYANESLFAARLHPHRPANSLQLTEAQVWVKAIRRILRAAIRRGGTTLRDFVGGDGKPGYFAQELSVYGRAGEPCRGCGQPLHESRQGNRSSVFCPHCQV